MLFVLICPHLLFVTFFFCMCGDLLSILLTRLCLCVFFIFILLTNRFLKNIYTLTTLSTSLKLHLYYYLTACFFSHLLLRLHYLLFLVNHKSHVFCFFSSAFPNWLFAFHSQLIIWVPVPSIPKWYAAITSHIKRTAVD